MRDESDKSRRGWGPFSGAQLTTMVCVVVAAVAFPVAASAVTGSSVFVTDATSGKTAKVSAAGAVTVAGTVTSKLQGATSGNKVEATAAQQLLTVEAAPKSFYSNYSSVGSGEANPVLALEPGKAILVKSLELSAFDVTGSDPGVQVYTSKDPGCATSSQLIGFVDFASGVSSTTIWPFDPALPIADGDELCMFATSASIDVTVTGYTIPAAAVDTPMRALPRPADHQRLGKG